MTDTPKPETGSAEPPAPEKQPWSERVDAFLLSRWDASRKDGKRLWLFTKELAILPAIFVPLVGWTGFMAIVGYAEAASFHLGFEDFSTSWIFMWGGMSLYTKASKMFGFILIALAVYFAFKLVSPRANLGFWGKLLKLVMSLNHCV